MPMDMSINSTDEEVVQFLEGRKAGDPIPNNFITEVNPFRVDPWNFPENFWCLYSSEGSRSPGGEFEIQVRSGYWRATNVCWITSTRTIGRKTTLEFYNGKSPFGERTGWVMHEYKTDTDTLNINFIMDYNSLCRVFQHYDTKTSRMELHYSATAVNSGGDSLDQWHLQLLEQEENSMSLRTSANRSQAVADKDQEQAALSSRPCESVAENFAENMYENYDFTEGDILKLSDLDSPDTSSSSDNSSCASVYSDEYFDPDEILRAIENDHGRTEDEHRVCKLNMSATVKSNQVVISPPPQGSVHSNGYLVIEEGGSTRLPSINGPTSHPAHDEKISEATRCEGRQSNQIADTSHPHRMAKENGTSKVSKIAKMVKRCCFF